jgi:hypothetical protein
LDRRSGLHFLSPPGRNDIAGHASGITIYFEHFGNRCRLRERNFF